MLKKNLLFAGGIFCVFLLGDIILLLTHDRLAANWSAIIVPSFFIGFLWKPLLKEDVSRIAKFAFCVTLGIVKVILFLLSVSYPTLLALIIMAVLYPFVSYIFLSLGQKLVPKKN